MLNNNNVYMYRLNSPDYETLNAESSDVSGFLLAQLEEIVAPGDKVVIKPNWVKESHLYRPNDWEYVITHPAVIKLVLDKVIQILNGKGEIYIIEAPQTDSDYEEIIRRIRFKELIDELQKKTTVKISYFDLREEQWFYKQGIIVGRKRLAGDPNGYVEINLKNDSEFYGKTNENYYGADYDMEETRQYHNEHDNIYVISKTVLNADVFINIPKLKTHKLAGITCCLKNLVGACVIKNSIPHHTLGTPTNGGDKFPFESSKNNGEDNLKNLALKLLKWKNPIINYPFIVLKKIAGCFFGSPQSDVIRNGAWYGNDTIWRAILDLNKILFYADKNGKMCVTPQRKYFAVVDGVIAGEGKGPMAPDPKPVGILLSGTNPVYIDTVAATLMGFDFIKIPTLCKAYTLRNFNLCTCSSDTIKIKDNQLNTQSLVDITALGRINIFQPHPGWRNHIEL
ncbi:DUF362 domain-containing protein [uncultured Cloacibacillus sp.]|uniref:DUF362 domain-containing protein n=1 Tax=uncultured Cloacibacillus sp. TaxID=889794 RepID=UPI0026DD7D94|nr:DUF362 domain-containing protein [uncultured Cloacibacillus sp.]